MANMAGENCSTHARKKQEQIRKFFKKMIDPEMGRFYVEKKFLKNAGPAGTMRVLLNHRKGQHRKEQEND